MTPMRAISLGCSLGLSLAAIGFGQTNHPGLVAASATRAHANIGQVAKSTSRNDGGGRVFLLTVQVTQWGSVTYFGTLDVVFEIKDASGQLYFSGVSIRQRYSPAGRVTKEWTIEITVEKISSPVLSAYSVRFSSDHVTKPLDEKNFGCRSLEDLTARNKDSRRVEARPLGVHRLATR